MLGWGLSSAIFFLGGGGRATPSRWASVCSSVKWDLSTALFAKPFSQLVFSKQWPVTSIYIFDLHHFKTIE